MSKLIEYFKNIEQWEVDAVCALSMKYAGDPFERIRNFTQEIENKILNNDCNSYLKEFICYLNRIQV